MRFEHVLQRIGRDLVLRDEPLRAALLIGDDDRCAPRGAFGVEGFEDVEAHALSAVSREAGTQSHENA